MARNNEAQTPVNYVGFASIGSGLAFNTNLLVLWVCRISTLARASGHRSSLGGVGATGATTGWYISYRYDASGNVELRFTKEVSQEILFGTFITRDSWHAGMAHTGTGADCLFKVLYYSDNTLLTETVSHSGLITLPVVGDNASIFQPPRGTGATFAYTGDIQRFAISQNAALTDNEFRAWAYGQRPAPNVRLDWTMWGESPEKDESSGALDGAITGTLPIVGNCPFLGPRYSSDLFTQRRSATPPFEPTTAQLELTTGTPTAGKFLPAPQHRLSPEFSPRTLKVKRPT